MFPQNSSAARAPSVLGPVIDYPDVTLHDAVLRMAAERGSATACCAISEHQSYCELQSSIRGN
ncbi:MAG: hypothetical protein AAFP90_14585, partial [Planctomycetota bacterium]